LHLEELWKKNITITTGLVDTYSAPRLLKLISDGQLDPLPLGTHHFKMDEIMDAYATAADAATMNALKVVLSAS
jgi:alcohol dehydrogenase